jgi:hypothetical protein
MNARIEMSPEALEQIVRKPLSAVTKGNLKFKIRIAFIKFGTTESNLSV